MEISLRSILMLGSLRACPPGNCEKNRCSKIESEGILEAKHHIMHIIFKSQNICEIKTSAKHDMTWRMEGEQIIISSHSIATKLWYITAIGQVQIMFVC